MNQIYYKQAVSLAGRHTVLLAHSKGTGGKDTVSLAHLKGIPDKDSVTRTLKGDPRQRHSIIHTLRGDTRQRHKLVQKPTHIVQIFLFAVFVVATLSTFTQRSTFFASNLNSSGRSDTGSLSTNNSKS